MKGAISKKPRLSEKRSIVLAYRQARKNLGKRAPISPERNALYVQLPSTSEEEEEEDNIKQDDEELLAHTPPMSSPALPCPLLEARITSITEILNLSSISAFEVLRPKKGGFTLFFPSSVEGEKAIKVFCSLDGKGAKIERMLDCGRAKARDAEKAKRASAGAVTQEGQTPTRWMVPTDRPARLGKLANGRYLLPVSVMQYYVCATKAKSQKPQPQVKEKRKVNRASRLTPGLVCSLKFVANRHVPKTQDDADRGLSVYFASHLAACHDCTLSVQKQPMTLADKEVFLGIANEEFPHCSDLGELVGKIDARLLDMMGVASGDTTRVVTLSKKEISALLRKHRACLTSA
jgi:hypothetical protein